MIPKNSYRIVEGREFKCTQCGKCCRWPGFVFLTEKDVVRLANRLTNGDVRAFRSDYTSLEGPRKLVKSLVLIDKPGDAVGEHACIFLENNKCSVYEDRPQQCKDYPVSYDPECPGFSERKKVGAMSHEMIHKVMEMNKVLSRAGDFERSVSNNLYEGLRKEASSISVTAKAIEDGVGAFFDENRIKVASLDDLFAFNRVDDKHLIHKSTRDLWSIEADDNGEVHITRLFDSGKPIKG